MRMTKLAVCGLFTGAATIALTAAPAQAQNADETTLAQAEEADDGNVIVVTARRREERGLPPERRDLAEGRQAGRPGDAESSAGRPGWMARPPAEAGSAGVEAPSVIFENRRVVDDARSIAG